MRPIATLTKTARSIATTRDPSERIPEPERDDEVGELARTLDQMLRELDAARAETEAMMQLQREFVADASHELRTPLTSLRSIGEVALHRSLTIQEYRDVVASMLEEVDRLTRLVENLLLLTRAEAGRIPMTRTVVNLSELVANIADNLRVLADEKDQAWSVDAAEPVTAACDAGILRQGVTNLVYNAIKYTPDKGVIRIATRRDPAGDAVIEVQDTGPGIAAAHRERIFERFYRVDDARSRESGGVGLGLAIARWAVEANAGRIELESDEGRGTLFRIVLPAS